ncbi:MAG: ABC transporter ATP-binding protein [Thermodesulfobacteriota bacterium]
MKKEIDNSDHEDSVLNVTDLSVSYETRKGDVQAIRGVSFKVHRNETVGLVGESGCGKSTTAFSIVGFLGRNGKVVGGSIQFQGQEITGCSQNELQKLRGNQITMVYQDPMQALNPSLRIGVQLAEALIFHQKIGKEEAWDRSIEMLKRVNMPDASRLMDRFPHQLSGGQQQRAVIAMAFLNNPLLLIMDEPTTSLDVTVEASVLDLIDELKRDFNTGILYITHNLGIIARVSDTLSVMYAGEIVEQGNVVDLFDKPLHPYTQGLLRSLPRLTSSKHTAMLDSIPGSVPAPSEKRDYACIFAPRCNYVKHKCRSNRPKLKEVEMRHFSSCFYPKELFQSNRAVDFNALNKSNHRELTKPDTDDILKIDNLRTYYKEESKNILGLLGLEKLRYIKAVDNVSLKVQAQRTLGIVGESGCGKSTLVKTLIGLEKSSGGNAKFLEFDLTNPLKDRELNLKKEIQMVFQNPDSTLNPSYSIGKQIGRRIKRFKICPKNQIKSRVLKLLKAVHLDGYYYDRLPRQLSGGEKQRVSIARALASQPKIILCDEPVSALDVSIQAGILNLLRYLQNHFGTTIIFISHDLSVVHFIADDVAVMYLGQIVEIGPVESIYSPPYHPYTEALLSAVPIPDPKANQHHIRLSGSVPSALNPPKGCRFHTRCPRRSILHDDGNICEIEVPPWRLGKNGHAIFCHIALEKLNKIMTTNNLSMSD